MKRLFALFIMLFALVSLSFAQRAFVQYGTYEASDTVSVQSFSAPYSTIFSHVGYDSIKFWISASDSVNLFIDRANIEPTGYGTKLATGSWTTLDSLTGTTNNGTGYGTGNLVSSTVWKGLDAWNYSYRLRFRSTGNGATGGSYRIGWLLKKR
ncbi:MAG: hypothetical protein WC549_01895 [Actinomycetota bacterium]